MGFVCLFVRLLFLGDCSMRVRQVMLRRRLLRILRDRLRQLRLIQDRIKRPWLKNSWNL